MGSAGSRLSRVARVRHHPRRAAVNWPTCATPCTTPQPNSANRTHHRTPKPSSHQPNPSPSHSITRSGTYIRPHLHRKWDATLTTCDLVSQPQVDVVRTRQITLTEGLGFVLPLRREPG